MSLAARRLVGRVGVVGALWGLALVLNRRSRRVSGASMEPSLRKGDVVLVLPRWVKARAGAVVVARDPRSPSREVIKRVAAITDEGLVLHGDRPDGSTDSRTFGTVPRDLVVGRVVRAWRWRR